MNSVVGHYDTHLAPIYVWMAGGIEHALSLGRSDLAPFLDTVFLHSHERRYAMASTRTPGVTRTHDGRFS